MESNVLKNLTVLYVEDDASIRNELSLLLGKFFKNISTANDGALGLEKFTANQHSIDIIITDINMPNLNGIDMVKAIRKINSSIPVLFTTAYSDKEFLSEAIQLRVNDYIIKPIDVRKLLGVLNSLGKVIHNAILVKKQNKELVNYKNAIDLNSIVIKTDTSLNITYVNDLFCRTTSFSNSELLGKNFSSLKHSDVSSSIFKEIYSNMLENKTWNGCIKYITKENNTPYIAETFVMSTLSDEGVITGAICIQNDITDDLSKKRNTQIALMKDKGDIFIKSKEVSAESSILVNDLSLQINKLEEELHTIKLEKDKFMYGFAKAKNDLKITKKELLNFKNNPELLETQSTSTLKTNKENSDFRIEVKKMAEKLEELEINKKRALNQQKINYEVEIDDLTSELEDYKMKIDSLGNIEIINQKIQYWKQKAKTEARRAEEIERKVVQTGDESFLKKIFSN